ncbi:MAG TPA: SDR family NAD(P)-dependent oxidoreductase, partial [Bordetella sp.]
PASLARQALGAEAGQRVADTLRARLAQALQTRAPGQRLGLVEISADTPLFAPTLCEGLDFSVADYRCASPDSLALESAERLRERFPALQTQHIGAAAAVPAWQADLVVLHGEFATHDTAQHTLDYALACLKPGGTLLVIGLQPAAWMDFIFGAQASWWLRDEAGAPVSAQWLPSQWQDLLTKHGLRCEDPLELAPDTASGPYLLAATLPAEQIAAPQAAPAPSGGWLILADDTPASQGSIAHALAEHLSSTHGLPVILDTQATPETLDALIAQARTTFGRIQGIVHAAGLEPRATKKNATALLQAQVQRCALAAGIAQACAHHGLDAALYLLTRGAAPFMPAAGNASNAVLNDASLWLYGRTMANETAGFTVRLVDLPLQGPQPLESLVQELLWPDAEQEIALGCMGDRHAPRLRKNPRPQPQPRNKPEQKTEPALRLGFDLPGHLRNLRWESHVLPAPAEHELEIRVQATGLNFRDVMYTLGLLSDEAIENGFAGPTLGLEFAGIVERVGSNVIGYKPGDAVVGFGPASFGNRTLTQANAISRIPPGMDFEAAATIPSTFFTVYYALHHLARLEPGERILIHGAAGGVGIAAIQYAQWMGAEIHATAGSDEKRDFLRLMGVEHVYDSRSLDFADDVLAATDGQGVDVVLNSLAGEAINRNLRVLKPFGRFLELGKRDFYENTRIGLRPFRNNISYFGIDADQLMSERPELTRRLFGEMMELFAEGVLHPLPYQVFDANEVVDAFRHMQQARQIGKIVVTYRRGIQGAVIDRRPDKQRPAQLRLPAQATYLVTGGLSGFGLRTAQWLADKGARNLVLASRSGPASDEARQAIADLQARGVTVLAQACDVTRREDLAALLAHVQATLPPVRGIVHAAMVIDDGLVHNATAEQIERVLAPKILGALHLDELSRNLPLDFFIIHSSGTTLFGNPGQANYVAANGWLEALARQRRARGLPATCPRWGAIADAGFLARNKKIKDALQSRMGGAALPAADALQALEDMLLARQASPCDLGVLELDWRALSRFLPTADTPRFAWVARDAVAGSQDDDHSGDIAQLLATLNDAELHPVVVDILRSEVSEILRVPADKINPERSVYDMGLDSLMGVELITALETRFGIRLPVMALSESPTLAKLATRLIDMLRNEGAAEHDAVAQQVNQVLDQHAQGMSFSSEAIAQFTEDIKTAHNTPKRRMIH